MAVRSYPYMTEQQALATARATREHILRIFDRRGIAVSAEVSGQIQSCEDLDVLGRWFDLALTVSAADKLLQQA